MFHLLLSQNCRFWMKNTGFIRQKPVWPVRKIVHSMKDEIIWNFYVKNIAEKPTIKKWELFNLKK